MRLIALTRSHQDPRLGPGNQHATRDTFPQSMLLVEALPYPAPEKVAGRTGCGPADIVCWTMVASVN